MTKEEAYYSQFKGLDAIPKTALRPPMPKGVEAAMYLYAKEIAIEFSLWKDRVIKNEEHYYWNSGIKFEHTTQELFNLYIKTKQ